MSTTLWRTPSGRLHWMRDCSGGATRRNTTKVVLTDEALAPLQRPADNICRCAWGVRDKARERLTRPAPVHGKDR